MSSRSPSHIIKTLFIAAFCTLAASSSVHSAALDPPHNPQGCLSCHDMAAYDQPNLIPLIVHSPLDIDDWRYNIICLNCHDGTEAIIAHFHSSQATGTKYGTWTVGCTVCHNQHIQEQDRAFGSSYGKFIQRTIDLTQILDNAPPTGVTVTGKSGHRAVKFIAPTGPNSYADGDEIIDGICEVCHTKTSHFRNDGSLSGVGVHTGLKGSNCLQQCHPFDQGLVPDYQCLDCHDDTLNTETNITRTNIKQQFSDNSHHVQRIDGSIANTDCYQCHWEADINGKITSYHTATPESAVDLVIYGANARPADGTYTIGTTAVTYTAGISPTLDLNPHCLGCHDSNTKGVDIFGDLKSPDAYAWDGNSIDERYSQNNDATDFTTYGKYSGTRVASKQLTKAFSAHGNADINEQGWDDTELGRGTDDITSADDVTGSTDIACFDCHNSHGSSAGSAAEKTTTYASATINGGILKDTTAAKGGYTVTYSPKPGGTEANKNKYNPGAALCIDCHQSADGNADNKPWGYQTTFGASRAIIGYFDTLKLEPGSAGMQLRYPFKALSHNAGGHFGASSPLLGVNGIDDGIENEVAHQINGLCSSCHDPHGVSPTHIGTCTNTAFVTRPDCLSGSGSWTSTPQYGVPMLKGTWMTSPYQEDTAPANNTKGTVRDNTYPLGYDGITREGVSYHIDQNTFGANIKATVTPVAQTPSQFAGLCLRCHTKSNLTNGSNNGTWKSVDRIHESVKGWGANVKHSYTCSKCHTPHIGSALPRLMITNCLNNTHKGRVGNYISPPMISGSGYGDDIGCYGDSTTLGGCPTYPEGSDNFSDGYGGFPGSFDGFYFRDHYGTNAFTVSCHEGEAADQSWNNVTAWADDSPSITSGPSAPQMVLMRMDESSWLGAPDEVSDSSGQENHGTAYNGADTIAGGISGRAGSFNGTDSYVGINYFPPLDTFTIEAWIKPSTPHQIDTQSTSGTNGTSGQRYLFGADNKGAEAGAGISAGTNGISVYEHGSNYMPALAVYSGTLSTTEWTHIAVVYTNRRPSIYVNGVLVRTGLQSAKTHVYGPTKIGGGTYGYFPGSIDDVAIHNRALSADDILLHYHRSSSGECNVSAAEIKWTTDFNSSSYVDYGETAGYGSTVGDASLVKNHSVTLSGLTIPVTLHYRIRSANGDGEAVSGDRTFTLDTCSTVLLPLLTSPTATGITETAAHLGANITYDGDSPITAQGTTWGTSANPAANILEEGSNATGTFFHLRGTGDGTGIPLPGSSKIYYRGYATNIAGTSYSPDGSFYTEPSTAATGVNFSSISSTGMTVNWTRGNGNGVIVLMKQISAVDSAPLDGLYTAYTGNPEFGTGTQIGTGNFIVYKGVGESVAVTGLSLGIQYHVAVYEYSGEVNTSGVNQGTNYISSPAINNATTTITPGSYSYTFDYTGSMRSLTIPAGTTNIQFSVKGAGGGGGRRDNMNYQTNGQNGHQVDMSYALPPVTLDIYVAGGGQPGPADNLGATGGWGKPFGENGENGEAADPDCWAYGGAGGGGASAIYVGTTLLTEAAGGSGGRSDDWDDYCYVVGGSGGAGGGTDYPATTSLTGGGAGGTASYSPTAGGNGQVIVTFDY